MSVMRDDRDRPRMNGHLWELDALDGPIALSARSSLLTGDLSSIHRDHGECSQELCAARLNQTLAKLEQYQKLYNIWDPREWQTKSTAPGHAVFSKYTPLSKPFPHTHHASETSCHSTTTFYSASLSRNTKAARLVTSAALSVRPCSLVPAPSFRSFSSLSGRSRSPTVALCCFTSRGYEESSDLQANPVATKRAPLPTIPTLRGID